MTYETYKLEKVLGAKYEETILGSWRKCNLYEALDQAKNPTNRIARQQGELLDF